MIGDESIGLNVASAMQVKARRPQRGTGTGAGTAHLIDKRRWQKLPNSIALIRADAQYVIRSQPPAKGWIEARPYTRSDRAMPPFTHPTDRHQVALKSGDAVRSRPPNQTPIMCRAA